LIFVKKRRLKIEIEEDMKGYGCSIA